MQSHRELMRLHRELDTASRDSDSSVFLSGWQTRHPFAQDYLRGGSRRPESGAQDYVFLSDSAALTEPIRAFHLDRDGVDYPAERIYASNGSSPLLMAYFLRLRELGITAVWFVPPIYYTCYYFAESLGITLRRLDTAPLFDPQAQLDLPPSRTVLLLSDPIWIFGAPVHLTHLKAVAQWQRETGSEVFVDGTFQYTAWRAADNPEASAELDPAHTFRLVCPTKSTAVHGTRFAYLLLPPGMRESIRYPAANLTGASGSQAGVDALRLMEVLGSPRSNRDLCDHIADVHRLLWEREVILAEAVEPSVSYYTFARIDRRILDRCLLMDQRFFDLTDYDGYVRVNLLHPDIHEL